MWLLIHAGIKVKLSKRDPRKLTAELTHDVAATSKFNLKVNFYGWPFSMRSVIYNFIDYINIGSGKKLGF